LIQGTEGVNLFAQLKSKKIKWHVSPQGKPVGAVLILTTPSGFPDGAGCHVNVVACPSEQAIRPTGLENLA